MAARVTIIQLLSHLYLHRYLKLSRTILQLFKKILIVNNNLYIRVIRYIKHEYKYLNVKFIALSILDSRYLVAQIVERSFKVYSRKLKLQTNNLCPNHTNLRILNYSNFVTRYCRSFPNYARTKN